MSKQLFKSNSISNGTTASIFFFVLVSFFVLPSADLLAANKWVGSGGSNSNSGNSRAQRWKTLTYALRNLQPGDTLTLLNGRYDVRLEPDHDDGVAYLRRAGFQRLDGGPNRYTTIRTESKSGVFVKGNLDIVGSYIRIQNLRLHGDSENDEPGLSIKDSHHIDVTNCDIDWCGGGGINASHSDCLRLIGNKVTNCGTRNYDQHSGISIYQPIPFPDPENRFWRIEIKRNKSSSNINRTVGRWGLTDGNGIILDDYYYQQTQYLTNYHRSIIGNNSQYPGRTLIEGNICDDNGGTGILCYLTSGVIIKNNTLVGNNKFIFDWNWKFRNRGQISIMDSDNAYILNNVMQSRYVSYASESNNSPYVVTEFRGENNFWENNIYHSTQGWSHLWNNYNVNNKVFYINPQLTNDLRSRAGFGRGITWNNHVYEDFYGRKVYGGQRTDLGAIQN